MAITAPNNEVQNIPEAPKGPPKEIPSWRAKFDKIRDHATGSAKRAGEALKGKLHGEDRREFDGLRKQLDTVTAEATRSLDIPAEVSTDTTPPDLSDIVEESEKKSAQQLPYKEPHIVYEEAVAVLPDVPTPLQMFESVKQKVEEQAKKDSREEPEKPQRKFSAIDKLRHKTLLLEAKARGIADLDGFQKLIEYFETTLTEQQDGPEVSVKSNITEDEKQALFRKWEAKGYKDVFISDRGKQDYLSMKKYLPLNLGREHIPILQKLLSLHPSPIEIIQTMQDAGMYFSDHDINPRYQTSIFGKTTTEYLGELMQSPHLDDAMRIVKGIRWGTHGVAWTVSYNSGEPKPFDTFLNLLHDENALTQLTPDVIEKINVLSGSLGRNVWPSELKQYIALLNNPDQFNGLVAMRYNRQGLFPGSGSIFNRLDSLQEANLLHPLTDLNTYGVDIDQHLYSYSRDRLAKRPQTDVDAIAQLQELIATGAMQDFLGDTEKRQFVRLVEDASSGKKLSVENIERDVADFDNREKLLYLRRLVYGENNGGNIHIPRDILESQSTTALFMSPEFTTFLNELKSIGYQPTELDFYNFNRFPNNDRSYRAGSVLSQAYRYQSVAAQLYDNPSGGLLDAIKDRKKMDTIAFFSRSPGFLETVKMLKKYNAVSDDSMPDIDAIVNIGNMKLLSKDVLDGIPIKDRQQWFTSVISLSDIAQNSLWNSLQQKGGFDESILRRTVDLSEIFKQVDVSAYATDEIKNAMLFYEGDVKNLFLDGQPTFQFAKFLLDNKNFSLFQKILSENSLSGFDQPAQKALIIWKEFPEQVREVIAQRLPDFPSLSEEQFTNMKKAEQIAANIDKSPSREMHRLKSELLVQLWELDNPEVYLDQIRQVFERNNLPVVGKIYRVFEIIQGAKTPEGTTLFDRTVETNLKVSPELKKLTSADRFATIYRDILRMHIDSDNPSLRHFMQVMNEGEGLVQQFESSGGINALTADQQLQLTYFLNKMDTLYINSLLGRRVEERRQKSNPDIYRLPSTESLSVPDRIMQLRKNFRVKESQRFTDRIAEMYVKPFGLHSLDEVATHMKEVKNNADIRNRLEAEAAIAQSSGKLTVKAGDILKGTPIQYFTQQLENGFGCREVLGADSNKDSTPYDADLGVVSEGDLSNGINSALRASPSWGYFDISLFIKDRGQFAGDNAYELIKYAIDDPRHAGIRTGFSSTEIDAIILKDAFDNRNLDKLYLTIAQNGFYIPVANTEGTIVFTPQMYDEYRKVFSGIEEFDGESLAVRRVSAQEGGYGDIKKLVAGIKDDEQNVNRLSRDIRTIISEVLLESGIQLRDPYDTSLYGADLLDTGSTGRHTNSPGDHDFDLMLLLDARDAARMQEVATKIKQRLHPKQDKSHIESDYVQVRAIGAAAVSSDEALDIDIGLGKRSDYSVFASHDAIATKLQWIRDHDGDDAYREVVANIVLAKKILKEGHAYKKGDEQDGGFGGVGTENWILANGGNLVQAFQSFYNASHVNGQTVPFEEFKKNYKIFDAGINLKYGNHDNYSELLKQKGYDAMVKTIEEYLRKQNAPLAPSAPVPAMAA